MIIPDTIDRDRLEHTIPLLLNKEYCHRGQGKTVAFVMLMAGEVGLSDCSSFVYVGENEEYARRVAQEFTQLITSWYGPEIIFQESMIKIKLSTGQCFFFTSATGQHNFWRGMRASRIFFDVSDEKLHFFNSAQETERLMMDMQLATLGGGDII